MKNILNNVRKFLVLSLFIISILVLVGEHSNFIFMIISKVIALTYFYMFLKANKVLENN